MRFGYSSLPWRQLELLVQNWLQKQKKGLVGAKKKRMPFVAANGLLVLLPAAIYLQHLASIESFDTTFYVIQAIELAAGFTNLTLMGLNIRDGLRMTSVRSA